MKDDKNINEKIPYFKTKSIVRAYDWPWVGIQDIVGSIPARDEVIVVSGQIDIVNDFVHQVMDILSCINNTTNISFLGKDTNSYKNYKNVTNFKKINKKLLDISKVTKRIDFVSIGSKGLLTEDGYLIEGSDLAFELKRIAIYFRCVVFFAHDLGGGWVDGNIEDIADYIINLSDEGEFIKVSIDKNRFGERGVSYLRQSEDGKHRFLNHETLLQRIRNSK